MIKTTHKITLGEARQLYATNDVFRNTIQTGCFLYVENSYILNSPEYVCEAEAGVYELTDRARNNLHECALAFDSRTIYKSFGSSTRGESTGYLMHSDSGHKKIEKRQVTEYNHVSQNVKLFEAVSEAKEAMQIIENLPRKFSLALAYLMDWRKTTNEGLAESTLMSSRTIQRMKSEPGASHKLGTIVAVCVGLKLFPSVSNVLLEMANINLINFDAVYTQIICSFYKSSIHECNELLAIADLPPLTKNE